MRDNLMVYGVPVQEHENCENVIKQIIGEQLRLQQAGNIAFDSAQRVGMPVRGKVRPIVAKFHYYKELEMVRTKAYEQAIYLKKANLGIGTQCPKHHENMPI